MRLDYSGVTRGLSQEGKTYPKGAHWPPFGHAIISSPKLIYVIPQKQKIVVGWFNELQLGKWL